MILAVLKYLYINTFVLRLSCRSFGRQALVEAEDDRAGGQCEELNNKDNQA